LNVLNLHLSPLRARKEDIPDLLKIFLAEMVPQRVMTVSAADLKDMQAYPWPGNVRELRNVIERAVIHAGDNNELHLCPLLPEQTKLQQPREPLSSGEAILSLAEIERNYAALALKKLDNNLTQTAKALGISLNTLKKKLNSSPKQ
jgi:DNA-binding NtrC family response regulator